MKDRLFRWPYTLLDDDRFDDGRVPRAVTLASNGPSLPSVVHAVRRPEAGGPWWFPQDIAHHGSLARVVLHAARRFSLLPVVPERLLLGDEDFELVAAREVQIPVFDVPPPAEATAKLREATRGLVRDSDSSSDDALDRWIAALDKFRRACPANRSAPVLVTLVRFSDHGVIESPPIRRTQAVIVVGAADGIRATEDAEPVEVARREYDNAMRAGRIDLGILASLKLGMLLEERGDAESTSVFLQALDLGRMILVEHFMLPEDDVVPSADFERSTEGDTHRTRLDRLESSPEAALRGCPGRRGSFRWRSPA